jgi:hypothetical protein
MTMAEENIIIEPEPPSTNIEEEVIRLRCANKYFRDFIEAKCTAGDFGRFLNSGDAHSAGVAALDDIRRMNEDEKTEWLVGIINLLADGMATAAGGTKQKRMEWCDKVATFMQRLPSAFVMRSD